MSPGKKKGGTAGGLLQPELVRQNLAHREWFHVTREGDRVHINVNVTRVPLPTRTLVATHFAALREGSQISLVFAQAAPGASGFAGAMTVVISARNIRTAIANEPFRRALREYAQKESVEPVVRSPDAERYPKDRVVTDRATIVAITFADDESEIRFFRVSPSDLHALQQGENVELLYPVVQVVMHTGELVHLVHTVDHLLGDLPQEPA